METDNFSFPLINVQKLFTLAGEFTRYRSLSTSNLYS